MIIKIEIKHSTSSYLIGYIIEFQHLSCQRAHHESLATSCMICRRAWRTV